MNSLASNTSKISPVDQSTDQAGRNSIAFLPVSLFGSVMGISGLALAWKLAHAAFGASLLISESIGLLALLMFAVLGLAYLAKLIQHTDRVKAEFSHPITGNFFGTIAISILLLSSVLNNYSAAAAQIVWTLGLLLTIGLSYLIVSRLLTQKQDMAHAVPAWLIPGVATLDIAVAGGTMPFAWAHEVNLFSMGIGSVLALVFFTQIMHRLIHQDALPAAMTPSLMILIAPFEVGFLAYVNVTQHVDMLAALLFYFGLFMFVVLFFKIFKTSAVFSPAWWAVSFPMAALANAALKYAMYANTWVLQGVAAIILAVLTVTLAVLLLKTFTHLLTGKLLRA